MSVFSNDMVSRKDLRKEMLGRRNQLTPQEITEKSLEAVERIAVLPAFQNAKAIMLYSHIRSELSLDALLSHPASAGKRFVWPLCLPDFQMKALMPGGWKAGAFGILEPDPDSSLEIAPEDLDLIICPGVAFDKDGSRLGMGGGYYDRFLPKCKNAVILMAAFELQKADHIPVDAWDFPMDMIVTEEGIYYAGNTLQTQKETTL